MTVFKFERGPYSCFVTTSKDGAFTFHNIRYPPEATDEVKDQFLEDAENAVLVFINRQGYQEHGND